MIRTGPRFTEAARAAAAQKRRERAAIKAETKSNFEVFVLRCPDEEDLYTWEIRQYGGVPIKRSNHRFNSCAEARSEGMRALARMPAPDAAVARPIAAKMLEAAYI